MLESNAPPSLDPRLTWNLTELYDSPEACDIAANEIAMQLPALEALEPIGADTKEVARSLERRDQINRELGRVAVYAQQRYFQNSRDADAKAMQERVGVLQTQVESVTSFIDADISGFTDEALAALAQSEPLRVYSHKLKDIARKKDHIQSPEVERELVSLEGKERQQAIAIAYKEVQTHVSTQTRKTIIDKEKEVPSSAALYGHPDRSVRQHAYGALHEGLRKERDALAEIYEGKVDDDNKAAIMRGFSSSLEAHLAADNVPITVYERLINTIHEDGLSLLQEYQELRREALGYEGSLRMYDVVAPFTTEVHKPVNLDQAVNLAKKALSPVGETAVNIVDKAVQEHWIDAYKLPGKRSGARTDFAPGAPHPFVLLNMDHNDANPYQFIHEVGGHAVHFYLSANQPTHEAYPDVFTGEAVALCNEQLLTEYLLATTTDEQERITVLTQSLDVFHRGFFRQAMFAEFEQRAHKVAQEGRMLTADVLDEIYVTLNEEYYGNAVIVDSKIGNEWGRLLNLFNQPSFYVYQYATGVAAAVSLTEQILQEGQPAVERYLTLLKAGKCDYSIDLLKQAGVDMTTSQPVEQVLKVFKQRTDELRTLLQKSSKWPYASVNTSGYIAK